MLDLLPAELTLDILSRLTVFSLYSLRLVSRHWNTFITVNEQAIYRQAAYLHDFTDSQDQSLEEALSQNMGSPWEGSVHWKDFCHRSLQLERNWLGKGRAVTRVLATDEAGVHRIKVDEKEQICITTHIRGGLNVTLLFPDVTLWSLPSHYVRPCAHCEYGNGFLVFDRVGTSKEVWRLASDFAADEVPALAPPDYAQRQISALTTRTYGYRSRGRFLPWALIVFPEVTFAFRFVYPILLSASESRAFLYDVRTATLVQTIEYTMGDGDDINYVDLSDRHVFLCAGGQVHVFSRTDGRRILLVPSLVSAGRVLAAETQSRPVDAEVVPIYLVPFDSFSSESFFPGKFIAEHVSADGRDLVLLREQGSILFIQDFEQHLDGDFESHALEVRLSGNEHQYFAFENGRVGVASRQGLYVFTLDSARHQDPERTATQRAGSFPRIALCGVRPYEHWNNLSCLQLSDRRVFFTWNIRTRRNAVTLYGQPAQGDLPNPAAPESVEMPALEEVEDLDEWEEDEDQEMLLDIIDEEEDEGQGNAQALVHMPVQLLWGAAHNTVVGCIDFSLMPDMDG